MPAPAVYVIAVLGTVAVGFAFKEFVYDPHIAPKVAQWRHDYTSRKEARRRRRMPVAVSVSVDHDPNSESDDDSSKRGQSGGFEMESLNPSQTRIRARTVSKEGIESWRTGIQSVISATSLRKRNHTGTSPKPADSISSPSSSTLTDQPRKRQDSRLVPIYAEAETGHEMNTHILTDVDTESISDSSSISSVRQVPSEVSVISSFDFIAPGTPAASSTITTTTTNTITNLEHHDIHEISSLSSLGSLQNLARTFNPIDDANMLNSHESSNLQAAAASNPFSDPTFSTMSFVQASSTSNPSTYPSQPAYPIIQSNGLNPFNPDSTTSSPSLVPSLSLSHPIPRADIEDGVVLLSPPSSSDTYSLYSAPTSRAMSPAVSEAFTSLSGVSDASGASVPVSASASVESLSELSDFSVLETTSERSGSLSGSQLRSSSQSSPRLSQQQSAQVTQGLSGGRVSTTSPFGGSSLSSLSSSGDRNSRDGGTITGRYLTRGEIQHLIDAHSTRPNRDT
ncbi:hypothetical protein GGU11DRAFT_757067 [Lentinula aff. detonsa]|nr:hypothetical protein GGU11DRAFT_757067 [Lentinula aff. detonsa]